MIQPATSTSKEAAGRRTYSAVSNEVHITPEVYERLAEKLQEMLEDQPNYLRDIAVEVEVNGCDYLFMGSMIIYWKTYEAPDGKFAQVENIVPVWWVLKAYVSFMLMDDEPQTECPTDAQFDKLKKYIIIA